MVQDTRIAPRRDELITSDNRMTQRFAEFLELQTDTVNNLDEKSGVQDSLIALSNRQRGKITKLEQEVEDLKEMIFELSARKKPIEQESESDDERFALNRLHNKITQLTNRLDDIESLPLSPNKNKITQLENRINDIEAEAGHTPKPPIINPSLVVGPASAANNAFARYDATTGKLIQDSGVICDDSDNLTGVAGIAHSENIVPADGKGLDFSAYTDSSVAGTTTSHILLDYEEGLWTPELTDGANTPTHTVQIGTYVKIGRMVHVKARLRISSLTGSGTINGSLSITGLPYTSSATAQTQGSVVFGYVDSMNLTAGYSLAGYIEAATSAIVIRYWDAAGGQTALQASEWSAAGDGMFEATYYV